MHIYKEEFVDEIISFIKGLENENIFFDIVKILNNIFLYKKREDLKKLNQIIFNELSDYSKKYIISTYKNLQSNLDLIIDSKENNKKNLLLRNQKDKNQDDTFLKLTIPIKILEELELTDEQKNQIELIDFPGLNSENNIFDKEILNPLITFSNGFLFITKSSIKEGDKEEIINSTISKISNRKIFDFSFDTILFILTHIEELKINLDEKKKEIKNVIYSSEIVNTNILNQVDFLITKFSNTFYNSYLKDSKNSENFEKLFYYLKNNIKNISPEESLKYAKKLRKDLKDKFFNKLLNKEKFKDYFPPEDTLSKLKNDLLKLINPKNVNNDLNNIIEEIIKIYLFFKTNIHNHENFIKSNGPDFNNQFKKLIFNSKKSYDKSLEKSIIYFIFYLQDKLGKINMSFVLKKANNLINEKKKKKKSQKLK